MFNCACGALGFSYIIQFSDLLIKLSTALEIMYLGVYDEIKKLVIGCVV